MTSVPQVRDLLNTVAEQSLATPPAVGIVALLKALHLMCDEIDQLKAKGG